MEVQNKENKEKDSPVFSVALEHLRDCCYWSGYGQKLSIKKIWVLSLMFKFPIFAGVFGHMYKSFTDRAIPALLSDVFYASTGFVILSSLIIHVYKIDEFSQLMINLNIHNHGTPEDFRNVKMRIDRITKLLHYYCKTAAICMGFITYFWDSECFSKKASGEMQGHVCGTVFRLWYPIELGFPPWGHVILIISLILVIYFVPKMAVSMVFFYGCQKLTTCRVHHLCTSLKKLKFNGENVASVREEFKMFVKYYSEICRLVDEINDTVEAIHAPQQHILIGLIIGLLEYQIVVAKNPKGLIPFIFWFLFQAESYWGGQCLEDVSKSLEEQVYDLPWYDLEPSMRSDFKIFYMQVQKTLQFKMKPLIVLNFANYLTVTKASYSFLMYLKNM